MLACCRVGGTRCSSTYIVSFEGTIIFITSAIVSVQFSSVAQSCPTLWVELCSLPAIYLEQTMVEVVKIMATSMHALLHSVPLALQQATTNPHLHWILLDMHR